MELQLCGREMSLTPFNSKSHHFVECAGLFEQMSRARNDFQFDRRAHPVHSFAVELDHRFIVTADEEQCGSFHERQ